MKHGRCQFLICFSESVGEPPPFGEDKWDAALLTAALLPSAPSLRDAHWLHGDTGTWGGSPKPPVRLPIPPAAYRLFPPSHAVAPFPFPARCDESSFWAADTAGVASRVGHGDPAITLNHHRPSSALAETPPPASATTTATGAATSPGTRTRGRDGALCRCCPTPPRGPWSTLLHGKMGPAPLPALEPSHLSGQRGAPAYSSQLSRRCGSGDRVEAAGAPDSPHLPRIQPAFTFPKGGGEASPGSPSLDDSSMCWQPPAMPNRRTNTALRGASTRRRRDLSPPVALPRRLDLRSPATGAYASATATSSRPCQRRGDGARSRGSWTGDRQSETHEARRA